MPALTASSTALDIELIRNPPARLRGTPFWSWNHDVTNHQALRDQIDALAEMGMGGVHIHSRVGLRTPYLSQAWFDAVRASHAHARSRGMLTWLYDEDTWPSGFAGGLVGRDLRWRQRWLTVAPRPPQRGEAGDRESVASGVATGDSDCAVVGCWRVALDGDGYLVTAERITPEQASEGDWWAWVTIAPDSSRFNGGAYLDVLNPAAVDAFIASTHEAYREAFGGSFPEDVPAIFTDEPQYASHAPLGDAHSGEARFPWTDDLVESFAAATGEDLVAAIPELVWTRREGPAAVRWRVFDHLSERFASAFGDRIGDWCQRHGIALTGHLMEEPTLRSQINCLGEAMRHYRSYQLPGIDMLCDRDELTTAKQAVSVARQDGRAGVLSELYGVTDWDFTLAGHKRQGDWQAALGVTVRVHHLTWLSMAGDAKRDYPASIGPQAPWYREYPVIEDHFARVGAALTQGRARVRIAVVHPIESAWLHSGPQSTDGTAFHDLDGRFETLTRWLVEAQLDFDFVCESLLPRQLRGIDDARLRVGAMAYDVVLVPGVTTLRASTCDALRALLDGGGTVLVCGAEPQRVDGEPSAARLGVALEGARRVPWTQVAVLEALEPWREVAVRNGDGGIHHSALYQLRELEGGERLLFVCDRRHGVGYANPWQRGEEPLARIRVRGHWRVQEIDTASGEISALGCVQRGDWTEIAWRPQPADHRLLHLTPGAAAALPVAAEPRRISCGDLPAPHALTREEPNVLVLDRAQWRLDGGGWQARQEIMRTQHQLIERFDWPGWCQPWCVSDPGAEHRLDLRFHLCCETSLSAPRLALERASETVISIDGRSIPSTVEGWWVDRCFDTVALPDLAPGEHVLELSQPIDALRRPEWCWLLHAAAVTVRGEDAVLTAPAVTPPAWGDLVGQGLPNYAGNLSYQVQIELEIAGRYALHLPNIAGPLARVAVDGQDRGPVLRAPWRVELGHLAAGSHQLTLKVFGHRRNAFGALHCQAPNWSWWGPPSWYRSGADHNEAWTLRPIGLTRAPILERLEEA